MEYLREGEDQPLPIYDQYSVFYEFHPNEEYLYACDYTPVVPPPIDRIRYTLWTTLAYDDGKTITSNVAEAEVALR